MKPVRMEEGHIWASSHLHFQEFHSSYRWNKCDRYQASYRQFDCILSLRSCTGRKVETQPHPLCHRSSRSKDDPDGPSRFRLHPSTWPSSSCCGEWSSCIARQKLHRTRSLKWGLSNRCRIDRLESNVLDLREGGKKRSEFLLASCNFPSKQTKSLLTLKDKTSVSTSWLDEAFVTIWLGFWVPKVSPIPRLLDVLIVKRHVLQARSNQGNAEIVEGVFQSPRGFSTWNHCLSFGRISSSVYWYVTILAPRLDSTSTLYSPIFRADRRILDHCL